MKRTLKFLFVMLAVVLVFGMMACSDSGDGTTPKQTGNAKSITITGLVEKSGDIYFGILPSSTDGTYSAAGIGTISGNSAKIDLLDVNTGEPWTGSGSYYLAFSLEDESTYIYTDGKTFAQLGITDLDEDAHKLPKYNISSDNSTIPFSKFAEVE